MLKTCSNYTTLRIKTRKRLTFPDAIPGAYRTSYQSVSVHEMRGKLIIFAPLQERNKKIMEHIPRVRRNTFKSIKLAYVTEPKNNNKNSEKQNVSFIARLLENKSSSKGAR